VNDLGVSLTKKCLVVSVMIKQQRRLEVTMEELFTKEEFDKARKIIRKYKDKPRYFREQKVSDQVVKPKIRQIDAYTGYRTLPEYWAYCLEHYLRSVRAEQGATRH
jgi:hypothetical protein